MNLDHQSFEELETKPRWELKRELEGKFPPLSLLVFLFVATKKATVALLPSLFFSFFVVAKKAMAAKMSSSFVFILLRQKRQQ
jgi:hypothetical protein